MMLSTRRSTRENTADSWLSLDGSRPSSRSMMQNGIKGLATSILGMFSEGRDGLSDVEEGSEEGELRIWD